LITITQAAVLGVVQGLTEFLPVSSSAHLVLVPWALSWPTPRDQMAFDVALHIGTILAMVMFFFFDWLMIIASYIGDLRQKKWLGGAQGSLLLKIGVACVPGAIVGKLFEKPIEAFFYDDKSNIWMLAITMSVFAVGLVLVERYGKQERDVKQITYRDALVVGCFQCIALIPGTSRSGITILAALMLGLTRPAAARFSFLAALPITTGAVLLKLPEMGKDASFSAAAMWTGIASSAIVGIIAIKGLLKYVQHRSYLVFAVYRWIVAAGIVALYLARR